MRLTITGANSRFARAVLGSLNGAHAIRAVDTRFDEDLPAGVEKAVGDVREREVRVPGADRRRVSGTSGGRRGEEEQDRRRREHDPGHRNPP